MQTQKFAGADKTNTSFLSPLERRVAPIVLPWIPSWLETYHLTMLTLLWSGLILVFSYLAARDLKWLWGVSVMIALQWVTDFFDGKVGKYRNTGPEWRFISGEGFIRRTSCLECADLSAFSERWLTLK